MAILNGISPGQTQKPSLKDLLQSKPGMLPVPEHMCVHMMSVQAASESLKRIKDVSTMAEMDLAKESWTSTKSAMKTFERGLTQAAKDSKAHMNQQVKERNRREKAELKLQEKKQVEDFKQQSDARAQQLLQNKRQASSRPLFKACHVVLQKLATAADDLPNLAVKPFPKLVAGSSPDLSQPWFACEKEHSSLQKWSADPVLKKSAEAFALKYKTFPDYSQRGRCSAALEPKHGHEQCDDLFSQFLPPLADFSSMGASAGFMKTNFIAGYAPEMCFAGFQANGAATLKAALMGEVLHVAVSLAALLDGLVKESYLKQDAVLASPEAFCDIIENLNLDDLKKLCKHGVVLYIHKQLPSQLLCLPMGWFTMEVSVTGSIIVCVRKGVFSKNTSQEALKEYDSLRSVFSRCGKPCARYDQVINLLKGSTSADAVKS